MSPRVFFLSCLFLIALNHPVLAQSECDADFLGYTVEDMFTTESALSHDSSETFRYVFKDFEETCGGNELFLDAYLSLEVFLYDKWLYSDLFKAVDEFHVSWLLSLSLIEQRPEIVSKLIEGMENRVASGDGDFELGLAQLDSAKLRHRTRSLISFSTLLKSGTYWQDELEPFFTWLDEFTPTETWSASFESGLPAAHFAYIQDACFSDSYVDKGALIYQADMHLVLEPEQVAESLTIVERNLFSSEKKGYDHETAKILIANLYSGCVLHRDHFNAELRPPIPVSPDLDKSFEILIRLVREDTGEEIDPNLDEELAVMFDRGIGTQRNPEMAALLAFRPVRTPFSFDASRIVLTDEGIGKGELLEANFYKSLSRDTISIMQRELYQLGLYRGKIDGLAGPQFMDAMASTYSHCVNIGVEASELCSKYFQPITRDQIISAIE